MSSAQETLKQILEAAILAAEGPLSITRMQAMFAGASEAPSQAELQAALQALAGDYAGRGIELKEVASGFRFQVRAELTPWIGRLWEAKPPRYSRALLETMALIAYRQPITRAEIEDIRGVSVSSQIVRTLIEREWVQVVGHKDVPGRPALLGTTRQFLDYFNLASVAELPPLPDLENTDTGHSEATQAIDPELALLAETEAAEAGDEPGTPLTTNDPANSGPVTPDSNTAAGQPGTAAQTTAATEVAALRLLESGDTAAIPQTRLASETTTGDAPAGDSCGTHEATRWEDLAPFGDDEA